MSYISTSGINGSDTASHYIGVGAIVMDIIRMYILATSESKTSDIAEKVMQVRVCKLTSLILCLYAFTLCVYRFLHLGLV